MPYDNGGMSKSDSDYLDRCNMRDRLAAKEAEIERLKDFKAKANEITDIQLADQKRRIKETILSEYGDHETVKISLVLDSIDKCCKGETDV